MVPKFSAVPWLSTEEDLRPGGSWDIESINAGPEIAHSIVIRDPFGKGTHTLLTIHAWLTGDICASEGKVDIVIDPAPSQSHVKRAETKEDMEDGA